MWEDTSPSTELPRDFCAGSGPLQLGVVLVLLLFIFTLFIGIFRFFPYVTLLGFQLLVIVWEDTSPSTELPRDFCAGSGPLQLGVVLVFKSFYLRKDMNI